MISLLTIREGKGPQPSSLTLDRIFYSGKVAIQDFFMQFEKPTKPSKWWMKLLLVIFILLVVVATAALRRLF